MELGMYNRHNFEQWGLEMYNDVLCSLGTHSNVLQSEDFNLQTVTTKAYYHDLMAGGEQLLASQTVAMMMVDLLLNLPA
jgi:hypothetical protein